MNINEALARIYPPFSVEAWAGIYIYIEFVFFIYCLFEGVVIEFFRLELGFFLYLVFAFSLSRLWLGIYTFCIFDPILYLFLTLIKF